MLYIVEGCDNSGKDTVIKELIKQCDFPPHVIHCSGINGSTVEESLSLSIKYYIDMFEICNYCENRGIDIILNRSHIGDYVYGQIYRDYTEAQANYVFNIECDYLETKGIYVTANTRTLLNRDDGLSQSKNNAAQIERELRLFKEAIDKSFFDFSTINTTGATPETIKEFIEGILN